MAKGKRLTKVESLEKKIAEINEKIEVKMVVVKQLKEEKAQKEKELKEAKLEDITSLLEEKGMTVEQLKTLIESQEVISETVTQEAAEEVTEGE